MINLYAFRKARAGTVFFRLVGHDDDFLCSFGRHLPRDLRHCHRAVNMLTASHGDRIVVENLVGHVDTGRDRRAHRQQAGMVIGAVTDILEYMRGVDERRLAHPTRALASHLRVTSSVPIHPLRHEMATNSRQCGRTIRQPGAGVVRTARTEIWGAFHSWLFRLAFFKRFTLCNALGELNIVFTRQNALSDRNGYRVRIERGDRLEQLFAEFVSLANHFR